MTAARDGSFLRRSVRTRRRGKLPWAGLRSVRNPASGMDLGSALTVHHDAQDGEFVFQAGTVPLLKMTIYQFDGSYASVAVALTADQVRRLGPGRQVGLVLEASSSRPLSAFLRLNLETPRAREQLHDTIVVHAGSRESLFDLAAARIDLDALESAWIDVIFSDPAMAEIVLDSVAVTVVDHGQR